MMQRINYHTLSDVSVFSRSLQQNKPILLVIIDS